MKFSKILVAAAAALAFAGAAQAALVIDTFDVDQSIISDTTGSAVPASTALYGTDMTGAMNSTSGVATAANIIGLQRDVAVYKIGGTGSATADVSEGTFNFAQSSSTVNGFAIVRWDGAGTTASQALATNGLGGVDLSMYGAYIQISSQADNAPAPYDVTFQVWSSADNGVTYTMAEKTQTVVSNNAFKTVDFSFGDFAGANFGNVGAIQMIVNTGGNAIGGLDFNIEVVGAVPEPGSIALVGAALLALGAARRRRQA